MLTRTSSSASSVPSTIVRPTLATVKTTVRSERVPEDRVLQHRREVVEADPLALALDQLGEPVALERERDELVERVAEDRAIATSTGRTSSTEPPRDATRPQR